MATTIRYSALGNSTQPVVIMTAKQKLKVVYDVPQQLLGKTHG